MAVEGVGELADAQVPSLDLAVGAGGHEELPGRVEFDVEDRIGVGVVVLDDPLGSDIVELDLLVVRARAENGGVGGELHLVDDADMVVVALRFLFGLAVPDDDGPVVPTGGDEPDILREHCAAHPVGVVKTKLEFTVVDAPDLDGLVVAGGDQKLAVTGELNAADGGTVRFDGDG